jgi:hypothetical protein
LTFFQSTSSSSAISIGSIVLTPWPISGFLATIVMTPSVVMRMYALGVNAAGACGVIHDASASAGSIYEASAMPPPASAVTRRKARRSID